MSYPAYLKSHALQINLPYPRRVNSVLFEYYDILQTETEAKCKECGKLIFMIKGSHHIHQD